jgi:hypothetical protein
MLGRHRSLLFAITAAALGVFLNVGMSAAQERPYFTTYNDHLEKPGEIEVSLLTTAGHARDGGAGYVAPWVEIEFGVTSRWTTEVYLEGVSVAGNGSGFTGWRLENRYRPLKNDHAINPVLYVEYENITEASRIQKEIVGSGMLPADPVRILNETHAHELEGRLILSSHVGAWNASENVIVEKNLSESEGVEFGYSVGVSRPLGEERTPTCHVCASTLTVGVEAYGGLGSTVVAPFDGTRHYVAPIVAWRPTSGSLVHASVGVGLTGTSDHYLLRFGYTIEVK